MRWIPAYTFIYLNWCVYSFKSFLHSAFKAEKGLHYSGLIWLFQLLCFCAFWKVESPHIVLPILLRKCLDCHRAGLKLFRTWWDSGFPRGSSASQNSGKAAKTLGWNNNYNALYCYKFSRVTGKKMHDGWRNYFLCSKALILATIKGRNLIFCSIYWWVCTSLQSSKNMTCFFNWARVPNQFLQ